MRLIINIALVLVFRNNLLVFGLQLEIFIFFDININRYLDSLIFHLIFLEDKIILWAHVNFEAFNSKTIIIIFLFFLKTFIKIKM